MEQVRARGNNSSLSPTVDLATTFNQEDPLLSTPNRREPGAGYQASPSPPPSTTNAQDAEKPRLSGFEPLRSKPLLQGFERPSFSRIIILTVLCLTTYPAFYILTLVAKDKSLFIVRLIVSIWCSGVGFGLGYVLLAIGAQHLEAATWATVVHMSHEGGGMKLRDLARGSNNPTSLMPALHIFRSRFRNRETAGRSPKSHDKRPWFLFLTFFVVVAILGPLLPFLFGRIIAIETFVRHQSKEYRENLIAGDLSEEDLARAAALTGAYIDFGLKWAFPSYDSRKSATAIAEIPYGNETIYFAQPSLSQFAPGGSGAGTFNHNQSVSTSLKDTGNDTLALTGRNTPKGDTGSVLRYPQWGIRNHCEKLPDPEVNLIPLSSGGYTYAFLPQDFLRGLYGFYGMDLPTELTKPDLTSLSYQNDTIPSNIDPSTISYVTGFPDNGRSIISATRDPPFDDRRWVTVTTYFIRVSTDFTPSGRFPVYSNNSWAGRRIGYDAGVCLEMWEPWIVETYNASVVSTSALRIVGRGDGSTLLSPSGNIRGAPIANTRYLNRTRKHDVFWQGFMNSNVRMGEGYDLGRTYSPSPGVVSFTEGTGPYGYTELSPDRLAIACARFLAAYALPYLVGSGPVVAQSYGDETAAYTTYKRWQLIGLPLVVWVLGIIGELFVPKLPLNIPRREFGVYSWLALFQSQELQFEAVNDLRKLMSLEELQEKFSDKRVKFVEKGGIDFFGSSE